MLALLVLLLVESLFMFPLHLLLLQLSEDEGRRRGATAARSAGSWVAMRCRIEASVVAEAGHGVPTRGV